MTGNHTIVPQAANHPAIMARACDSANFCSREEGGGGRRGSSSGTGEISRGVGDILYVRH